MRRGQTTPFPPCSEVHWCAVVVVGTAVVVEVAVGTSGFAVVRTVVTTGGATTSRTPDVAGAVGAAGWVVGAEVSAEDDVVDPSGAGTTVTTVTWGPLPTSPRATDITNAATTAPAAPASTIATAVVNRLGDEATVTRPMSRAPITVPWKSPLMSLCTPGDASPVDFAATQPVRFTASAERITRTS